MRLATASGSVTKISPCFSRELPTRLQPLRVPPELLTLASQLVVLLPELVGGEVAFFSDEFSMRSVNT